MQKGLPLAYNRDLQQDKVHLFRVDDDTGLALRAMAAMVDEAEFSPPPPSAMVTALDLAELLTERGVPFRQAHEVVGSLVAAVVGRGADLSDVSGSELAALHPLLTEADTEVLDPVESVRARRSSGGGSFASVERQLAEIEDRIGEPGPI